MVFWHHSLTIAYLQLMAPCYRWTREVCVLCLLSQIVSPCFYAFPEAILELQFLKWIIFFFSLSVCSFLKSLISYLNNVGAKGSRIKGHLDICIQTPTHSILAISLSLFFCCCCFILFSVWGGEEGWDLFNLFSSVILGYS